MKKWTSDNIPNLSGKTAVVTGANSGIGYWTAYWLAVKGARVILASRDPQKAETAAIRMGDLIPELKLDRIPLDLASFKSIHKFSATFSERYSTLDILINNAGVMAIPFRTTVDGFEMQFGTNHLGHFALTGLLMPPLLAASEGRVVTISSLVHRRGSMDFENLNGEKDYDPWTAYQQSKVANLLFAYELQRKLEAARIPLSSIAAHPGYSATNLQYVGPEMEQSTWNQFYWRFLNTVVAQSSEMGALPSLFAATDQEVEGGDFIAPDGMMEMRGHPVKSRSSVASYSREDAAKLWQISEELTSVQYFLTTYH